MIARFWSARATPVLSDSYVQHFARFVRPELRRVEGFLGATVSTRPAPGSVEILVTTYWTSFSAIEAFAGSDREAAVVGTEAAALLMDYDQRVRHYEIALAEFPAQPPS